MATNCQHCARPIVKDGDTWVDPEASGDDVVWRETCDSHDSFTAEHEPPPAPAAWNRRKDEWKLWGCVNNGPVILLTRGTAAHCERDLTFRTNHAHSEMVVLHESQPRPEKGDHR